MTDETITAVGIIRDALPLRAKGEMWGGEASTVTASESRHLPAPKRRSCQSLNWGRRKAEISV